MDYPYDTLKELESFLGVTLGLPTTFFQKAPEMDHVSGIMVETHALPIDELLRYVHAYFKATGHQLEAQFRVPGKVELSYACTNDPDYGLDIIIAPQDDGLLILEDDFVEDE